MMSLFNQQQPFFFLSFSSWTGFDKFTVWPFWWVYWGGAGFCCCLGAGSSFDFLPPAVIKAKSLKNYFTFAPVLADTSIKVSPSFLNSSVATLVWTALYSSRSFLLPTISIKASSPLTYRTLSIHLDRLWYELASK
jgi:hypothetical protein